MSSRAMGPRDLPAGHPGRQFMVGSTPLMASMVEQRVSYCTYVPDQGANPGEGWPVIVAVHGSGREVHQTREGMVDLAERHRCVVVAPLFPMAIGNPNDLDNYKFLAFQDMRFDLITLGILDEVVERWGVAADRFLLYGFSGGGQFVQRFAYLHPERLAAVSVGAPGRTTVLDPAVSWPDGVADLDGRFGKALDLDQLRRVSLQVVVGGADTNTAELMPGSTGGANRVERAQHLVESWRSHGLTVRFDVVPGAAHDSSANLPATLAFFDEYLAGPD